MAEKVFSAVLIFIFFSLIPPCLRAEPCYNTSDMVCAVYQICRYVLDTFPESEITEKGKDCTLTIEGRQLIIRRKRVGGGIKYFVYAKAFTDKERGGTTKFISGAKNTIKKTVRSGETRFKLKPIPAFRSFGVPTADVVDPNGQLVRLGQ
jgi:hypothetical protein